MDNYSPSEMMVARAARELRNGEVVFVGIGLPNVACNLARRLQAPGLVLIYESGAVGCVPDRLTHTRRHLAVASDFIAYHVVSRPLKSLTFLGRLFPPDDVEVGVG